MFGSHDQKLANPCKPLCSSAVPLMAVTRVSCTLCCSWQAASGIELEQTAACADLTAAGMCRISCAPRCHWAAGGLGEAC